MPLKVVDAGARFLGALAGVGSFLSGMASIIRAKDRSIAVLLATALGSLVVFFVLGEVLFPH